MSVSVYFCTNRYWEVDGRTGRPFGEGIREPLEGCVVRMLAVLIADNGNSHTFVGGLERQEIRDTRGPRRKDQQMEKELEYRCVE